MCTWKSNTKQEVQFNWLPGIVNVSINMSHFMSRWGWKDKTRWVNRWEHLVAWPSDLFSKTFFNGSTFSFSACQTPALASKIMLTNVQVICNSRSPRKHNDNQLYHSHNVMRIMLLAECPIWFSVWSWCLCAIAHAFIYFRKCCFFLCPCICYSKLSFQIYLIIIFFSCLLLLSILSFSSSQMFTIIMCAETVEECIWFVQCVCDVHVK